MTQTNFGSLTKEPPLEKLDAAILAAAPGMPYQALLDFARHSPNSHRDAPGLISKRFLIINNGRISYDYFLSLTKSYSLNSALLRKVMYFVWAYRDERIRRFICEVIADSSGNWRPTELTNKRNADFFNLWLSKKASKKARSNFEFFLSETGIFDASSNTVRLEREDGWLEQAAIVAAQHEPDLVARDELLANPINFLRDRGWLGLLNSDDTVKIVVPPTNLLDTDLLEDESIETCPATVSQSRDWDRRPPSGASSAKGATFNLNMIARERANKSHYDLEKALADLVRKIGCAPKYNQNIDLHFEVEGHSVLVEIKSCTDRNFHTQARRGISQLLEYRFLYRDLLDPGEWMLLLMEAAPPEGKEWLVEHASSVGIILAWMDAKSEKVVTTTEIPATLTRVLSSV